MNFKVSVLAKNQSENEAKVYEFPPRKVKIGRLKDNDIVLNFPAISGYHGKLRLDYNGKPKAFVTDFGSLNGIIVNGEKIDSNKEVPVDFDKTIDLGIFSLKVEPLLAPEEAEEADTDYDDETATMPLTGLVSRFRKSSSDSHKKEESKSESDSGGANGKEVSGKGGTDSGTKKSEEKVEAKSEDSKQSEANHKEKEEETTKKGSGEMKNQEVSEKDKAGDKNKSNSESGGNNGAKSGGKTPAEATITMKAGETIEDLDFFAEEIFSISGVILNRGKPLSGVTVAGGDLGEIKTDGDGAFNFDEVLEGSEYNLIFSKNGFEFKPDKVNGEIEEDLSLTITGTRMIELNGRVLHKDKPLANVKVDAGDLGETTTQADGYFNLPAVAEDTEYELSLSKPEFRFEPEKVKGKMGDDKRISVSATKLITVKGRVVHKGKPLAEVVIDAGPLGKTTTDDNGVYQFKDVPEDTEFTIKAQKPKYRLASNKKG